MQWVATLDTGRFGDWVIVEADTEEEARAKLTRAQRRKTTSVKPSYQPGQAPPAKLGRRR